MTSLKVMIGFLGCGVLGSASGVGARAIYWHMMGVSVISEQTLIPIGVMVAVGVTLLTVGLRVGSLIQGFRDDIKQLNDKFDRLDCMKDSPPSCPAKPERKK